MADRDNHHIQVFTAEGNFLRMFGRRGVGRGELNEPRGVAIDSSDRVYVSEYGSLCSPWRASLLHHLAVRERDQDSFDIPLD